MAEIVLLQELEGFAASAVAVEDTCTADQVEITRWQSLFGYTFSEAQGHIERQQMELDCLVPLLLWETVREHQKPLGHDRASYSHWLATSRKGPRVTSSPAAGSAVSSTEYLVRLEGPVEAPQMLSDLLGRQGNLEIFTASSLENGGTAQFCRIDARDKAILLAYVAKVAPRFSPLIVSSSYAKKELCSHTPAPFVGLDTTLPHLRLSTKETAPRPAQNEYPVWYFFYGTLASQETLARLFGHLDPQDTVYDIVPACIRGAALKTWGAGKYRALVDAAAGSFVNGSAFLVTSKVHEDALCFYETGSYEVARCEIERADRSRVPGCVFRFVGALD